VLIFKHLHQQRDMATSAKSIAAADSEPVYYRVAGFAKSFDPGTILIIVINVCASSGQWLHMHQCA
jgi:hypothetical protein